MLVSLGQLLLNSNCNVLQSDQFTDDTLSPAQMFQRIEFDYSGAYGNPGGVSGLEASLAAFARRFNMDWKVRIEAQACLARSLLVHLFSVPGAKQQRFCIAACRQSQSWPLHLSCITCVPQNLLGLMGQ